MNKSLLWLATMSLGFCISQVSLASDCINMTQRDGGIGGTGVPFDLQSRSTGVVGMITGFASICVNGLEIHYDESTPVTQNGRPIRLKDMAVGQVVAVQAVPTEKGLVTQQITVLNAVEGRAQTPVERVNANQTLMVHDQKVLITDKTMGNALGQAIRQGEPLAVSGYRNASGVIVGKSFFGALNILWIFILYKVKGTG